MTTKTSRRKAPAYTTQPRDTLRNAVRSGGRVTVQTADGVLDIDGQRVTDGVVEWHVQGNGDDDPYWRPRWEVEQMAYTDDTWTGTVG